MADRRAHAPLAAARTLVEQHDPAAVPALLRALEGRNRDLALKLLGDLGPSARSAIPRVRNLLAELSVPEAFPESVGCVWDENWPDRCSSFRLAASTLWRIGQDASMVLPHLERQLQPDLSNHAYPCAPWALRVLAEMGPAAASARPTLLRIAAQTQPPAADDPVQFVLRSIGVP